MTLIVALGNSDQLIQIADRRVTVNGRLEDDETNKAGVLLCKNGRLAYAFTGLARAPGFETRTWLNRAILECGPPDYYADQIMQRLEKRATADFRNIPALRRISRKDKRLSVFFSGYLYHHDPPLLVYALLTNYIDAKFNGHPEAFDAFICPHGEEKRPNDGNPTLVQRVGFWPAVEPRDIAFLRNLLRRRLQTSAILAPSIAKIREIADRPSAKGVIGKQFSSIIIPRQPNGSIVGEYHTEAPRRIIYTTDVIVAKSDTECRIYENGTIELAEDGETKPVAVPPVAKNARCPCGSGKKYKRCCGKRNDSVIPLLWDSATLPALTEDNHGQVRYTTFVRAIRRPKDAPSPPVASEAKPGATTTESKAKWYLWASVEDYKAKSFGEAIANAQKSITILPTLAGYLNFSAFLTHTQQYAQAEDAFRRGLEFAQRQQDTKAEAQLLSNRGVYHAQRGEGDKSFADFTRAAEIDPSSSSARFNLAAYYHGIGAHEKALGELQHAMALEQDVEDLEGKGAREHDLHGSILAALGNHPKALAEFNTAIHINPRFVSAYNNRGMIYVREGELDLAKLDFDKTIEIDPSFAGGYGNRAVVYIMLGKLDEGIADCDVGIKIEPRHPLGYMTRGRIYAIKGLYDKAIEDFDKVIELRPRDQSVYARAYVLRGNVFELRGMHSNARSDYESAIKHAPNYAEGHFHHGHLLQTIGMPGEALIAYTRAVELNPDYVDALINRSGLLILGGKAFDAIRDLNHAIALKPESCEAHNNRGNAYRVLEHLDNAVQDFTKALECNPHHADALFNRGHVLKATGRLELAREDFFRACQLGMAEACREYQELAR